MATAISATLAPVTYVPAAQASQVTLLYQQGVSPAEIAAILDLPELFCCQPWLLRQLQVDPHFRRSPQSADCSGATTMRPKATGNAHAGPVTGVIKV